jgi:hypothetical protein
VGWTSNLGSLAPSSVTYSGMDGAVGSCELCPTYTTPGAAFILLSTTPPVGGPKGAAFLAAAYVRLADAGADAGASPPSAQLQLEYYYDYDGGQGLYTGGSFSQVTDAWTSITSPITFDQANESVQFLVFFDYAQNGLMGTGGCVLISDVSLIAQ